MGSGMDDVTYRSPVNERDRRAMARQRGAKGAARALQADLDKANAAAGQLVVAEDVAAAEGTQREAALAVDLVRRRVHVCCVVNGRAGSEERKLSERAGVWQVHACSIAWAGAWRDSISGLSARCAC